MLEFSWLLGEKKKAVLRVSPWLLCAPNVLAFIILTRNNQNYSSVTPTCWGGFWNHGAQKFWFPTLSANLLFIEWCFVMVFPTCIYCTLIKLTLFITHFFSITQLPYYLTVLSEFGYVIFIHRCTEFPYYSLSIILFSSPVSPSPFQ
jgi:hypothetical protein